MVSFTPRAHVVRITHPTDNTKWVDVIRREYYGAVENAGAQGQGYHLDWKDDSGDGTGQSANSQREMETITLKDSDGADFVDVPSIKRMTTNDSGQRSIWHFKNDKDSNTARRVINVKVHPVDIGSTDPTTPIDWETYKAALDAGTVDTSKYLPVSVPKKWATKQQQGIDYQGASRTFRNQTIVDDLANMEETDDDSNTVWLDPFQFVVNWSGGTPTPGPHGLAFTYLISPTEPSPPSGNVYCQEWIASGGTRSIVSTGYWQVSMPGDGTTITVANPTPHSSAPLAPPDSSFPDYWAAGTYHADQVFTSTSGDTTTYVVYVPVTRFGA